MENGYIMWSLDNLYKGFDEGYLEDTKRLKKIIDEFIRFAKGLNDSSDIENNIVDYIDIRSRIIELSSKLTAYPGLRSSVDTKDKEAGRYLNIINSMLVKTTEPLVTFKKWIGNIDDLDSYSTNETIGENIFHLKELAQQSKRLLSEGEESLYAQMNMVAGDSWGKLQKKLSSSLTIEFTKDGKEEILPIASSGKYLSSSNAELRESVFNAMQKSYARVEDEVAMALSNIKRQANIINKLRGYKSPIDATLEDSRMKKETLDALLSSMEKYLPDFRRYLKKKAEYLGYSGGLKMQDISAPVGNTGSVYTYKEAMNLVKENYGLFSDKLKAVAERAEKEMWIDVSPRKGKRGGAFCYNTPFNGESKVMLNFTGSFGNVSTLAHELGHAYHGSIIKDNTPLNWSYPMQLAETASIICETILKTNMISTLKDDEKLMVLESSIKSFTAVIVDILARYRFEGSVFEACKDTTLASDDLKVLMLNAQKEVYGDGLNHDYLDPYAWVTKPHYYYMERHFYNFPYAFGLLYAKGLYAQYLSDGDKFIQRFDEMLMATTKDSIEDVAKLMDIDVTREEFWCSSLEIIKKDIDMFCELVDKK